MSRLLVIGGSDSSGGAGVFADLKTCHDLGCEVSVAITAVTAQSDRRHYHSHVLPEEALQSQLLALGDFGIDAVKIGMLPDLESIEVVRDFLLAHSFGRVVLDPVFSSSSGGSLSTEQGIVSLSKLLFPHVGLITPNFSEASRLIKQAGLRSESQEAMAAACLELGPKAALVKGGHCSGEECVDFLATDDGERIAFSRKRIPGGSKVRGTGCRLASAIACFQAKGLNLKDSVGEACEYLAGYISDRVDCG
ncbi:MAG: hydroxymethylpyrimidine/phosphomethylpyrimidine kinase [Opitutae bacterium]